MCAFQATRESNPVFTTVSAGHGRSLSWLQTTVEQRMDPMKPHISADPLVLEGMAVRHFPLSVPSELSLAHAGQNKRVYLAGKQEMKHTPFLIQDFHD